ncbi:MULTISPECIES: hypothetical protein [unclassified Frankia]|uniref:PepSY domain-containing protein n=1 Tax=unclassified Frankia TaxID=2632575 RepID=UPI002AD4381D|nr:MULTISPECIES: hypothetical protein [unclassified Frankia]
MTDDQTTGRTRSKKGLAWAAGLVTAGALTGGVLAGTISASAATENSPAAVVAAADSSSTTPTAPATTGTAAGQPQSQRQPQGQPKGQAGGATPARSDEKQLTGTDAEKARAAALQAVPGGTVYRVETDAGDAEYEAHMKKADGSLVTVKLDKNFTVIKVEDGMGAGDPAPSGQHGTRKSG